MLKRKTTNRIVKIVLSLLVTFFVLSPFAWMVTFSLRTQVQIFESPPRFFPRKVVTENYETVLGNNRFGLFFRNSIIVSISSTLVVITVACLAGYGFSRFTFRGKRVLTFSILSSQLFPIYVIIIPLFIVYNMLALYDTITGLIVVYTAISLPFSIFLMSGFFNEIPKELEESAYIDGASKLQAFLLVVLPNCLNGITAISIFVLISTWQEFLLALSLTVSEESRTLPVGLMYFFGQYRTDYGGVMAASVLATIPTIIIFLFLQKYFIRGMISGTVKG